MIQKYSTLYKVDSKGKLREWRMETDGARYRTVSGLADGKQVTSEWKDTVAKNVGRTNATTAEEQATAEVLAEYKKRLEGEYSATPTQAEGGFDFFKPMLADKWENRKDKLEYPVFVQPKLDGIRCVITREGMFSRTGKPIVAAPHIWEVVKPLFRPYPQLILDGELYNHDLRDDFNKIVSLVRKTKPSTDDLVEARQKIQYHIYDLPSSETTYDVNAEEEHKQGRLKDLEFIFEEYLNNGPAQAIVRMVPTQLAQNEDEADQAYAGYLADGYEGGIVRTGQGLYVNKRSKDLLKRKDFQDEEFKIVRIEQGSGNWAGYAKRVIFELPDGREATATLKGNQAFCAQVLSEADDYISGQVTVQYFALTPDGVPRFPIAKTIFKGARDV
jgi:DNA ligase-1